MADPRRTHAALREGSVGAGPSGGAASGQGDAAPRRPGPPLLLLACLLLSWLALASPAGCGSTLLGGPDRGNPTEGAVDASDPNEQTFPDAWRDTNGGRESITDQRGDPTIGDGTRDTQADLDDAGPGPEEAGGREGDPAVGDRNGPVGWAALLSPPTLTVRRGQTSAEVFGQVYAPGVTDVIRGKPAPGLKAELGYGPQGSHPGSPSAGWTWVPAAYTRNAGISDNNHEHGARLLFSRPGAYSYAYRFSLSGSPWIYADRGDGGRPGTNDGFQVGEMGRAIVVETGAKLTVVTMNLHCLTDAPQTRFGIIARELASLGVDAVAFQEVCRQGPGLPDSARQIADLLGRLTGRTHRSVFVQTHVSGIGGNSYPEGLGLVTRHEILDHGDLSVPAKGTRPSGAFPRKGLWARLATPAGVVTLVSTHLSYRSDHGAWREQQAKTLRDAASSELLAAGGAVIVAGDLNEIPGGAAVRALSAPNGAGRPGMVDVWAVLNPGKAGPTFPVGAPTRRIDYQLLAPGGILQPSKAWLLFMQKVSGLWVSDHLALAATYEVP